MTFTIVARDDASSEKISHDLRLKLETDGHQYNDQRPEYIFFVGGDGTFLRAVQHFQAILSSVIFIGIHSGSLGFFCEYSPTEIPALLSDIPTFQTLAKSYPLLSMTLEGEQPQTFYAVNEVRVEDPFQTLVTHVHIDQEHLETFRGTGLIVSSTLGSSAYNKSLGGSVVDGRLPTLQLTEMASIQNNVYRSLGSSLVLDPTRKITFKGDFKSAIFGYDHQLYKPEKIVDSVTVSLSGIALKIVHQKRHSYIETIRKTFVKN